MDAKEAATIIRRLLDKTTQDRKAFADRGYPIDAAGCAIRQAALRECLSILEKVA